MVGSMDRRAGVLPAAGIVLAGGPQPDPHGECPPASGSSDSLRWGCKFPRGKAAPGPPCQGLCSGLSSNPGPLWECWNPQAQESCPGNPHPGVWTAGELGLRTGLSGHGVQQEWTIATCRDPERGEEMPFLPDSSSQLSIWGN